jgi:hypothetical protein
MFVPQVINAKSVRDLARQMLIVRGNLVAGNGKLIRVGLDYLFLDVDHIIR